MKKRFLVLLSMIFVFALFGAAFALNGTNTAEKPANDKAQKTQTVQTADAPQIPIVRSDEDCCKPGADCCKGGSCCHRKKK